MDLMTSRPALALRGVARRLHLRKYLSSGEIWNTREEDCIKHFVAEVRPDDVVWDVGAFYGLYTGPIAEALGPTGKVYAFEPNPLTREGLGPKLETLSNAVLVPVALGATSGTVDFIQKRGRSRVVPGGGTAPDTTSVRMESADALVRSGEAPQPSLIKIDAEGLELDILRGAGAVLAAPALRALFLEVHFRLLAEREPKGNAPAEIVEMLKSHSFRCRWIGMSHLWAQRTAS
jgi:FkbM family methyltransferase